MKIIIETILIVLSLLLLNSCNINSIDQRRDDKFSGMIVQDDINYDYRRISIMATNQNYEIACKTYNLLEYTYESGDTWQSIDEIIKSGQGDCEDFCKLFINIAYVEYNLKCNMVLVSSRSIIEGGDVSHAIVEMPDGTLIEPQTGNIIDTPIGFRYKFKELFNE